jgi:hypothetical protein
LAVVKIIETRLAPEAYDQILVRLGVGDTPPPGGAFHIAALGEEGEVRIVELWDSRQQAEAWGEKVAAARAEAGFAAVVPTIEYLEVHNVIER